MSRFSANQGIKICTEFVTKDKEKCQLLKLEQEGRKKETPFPTSLPQYNGITTKENAI